MAGVTDTAVEPPSRAGREPGARPAQGWLATYRYPLTVFAASRVAVYAPDRGRVVDEPRPAPVGRLVARALRRARAVGRRLVPLDRRPRLRPGDRPRERGRVLPALPAHLEAVRRSCPGPMELWGSLLSTALFGGALCLLYRITLGRYDEAMARRTVLYLSIFPLDVRLLAAVRREPLPAARPRRICVHVARPAVGRRGRRRAGGARAPGGDRAPARRSPGGRTAGRPARAAVSAAPAPAAGRGALLRVPGLAHRGLAGQRPCPGARLGARRRRAAVRVRLHALARRDRGRPSAIPRPPRLHALLVRRSSTRPGGCGCRPNT